MTVYTLYRVSRYEPVLYTQKLYTLYTAAVHYSTVRYRNFLELAFIAELMIFSFRETQYVSLIRA